MKAAFSAVLLLLVCTAGAQYVDGIQAIVQDTPITYFQVAERSRPALESLSRDSNGREDEFRRQMSEVMSNNLDLLVNNQLILQEFKTYNVPETILDKDVDKYVQEYIQKNYYGDRTTMIKSLQAEGRTLEQFRRQTRERFIESALRSKNVGSEVIVSPHRIEAYYLAHKDEYKLDDEVKLRVIVLNKSSDSSQPDPTKLADEIITKVKDGADFGEMASIYSQGSQARAKGDWGWYETKKLRKEFAEAALKLQAGQNSGVIDTPEACYIIKVDERKPARYKSLGDVREEIEHDLALQEQSRAEKQWIAKLKKKTFVKYYQQ